MDITKRPAGLQVKYGIEGLVLFTDFLLDGTSSRTPCSRNPQRKKVSLVSAKPFVIKNVLPKTKVYGPRAGTTGKKIRSHTYISKM